jgi:hypothetical protein
MTMQEKRMLSNNIRKLQPQFLRGVLAIVKEAVTVQDGSDEMEFDIDSLPPKTCRKLE